ncbi:hypothetical protein TREMEDRAFT_65889 [Tremella mesenterica DSM 1558]|uniref:uncharacterized protein n=1 Tax=Tremella mesenterica (strain ATCC 24925 / CBS 8224 / DSM 1558 / NBRC 9311 / NRRL Y-6157 / RJB 2259-6 / UBC 559-6) TaxID=578456 RepID=UPI00032C4B37|nr:uncharacterized protein TREMEDRAFT_65889 [Tremella mesenterica DSM 1558]EIW66045.1 hypothetical protein TREMEDRAFT_65889 [Tremella mesenterica DSM 1558]
MSSLNTSMLPDLKPKSPRRFFTFSPHSHSPPPLPKHSPSTGFHTPTSSTSSNAVPPSMEKKGNFLGGGAQVVRTPSEARRGMRKDHLPSSQIASQMQNQNRSLSQNQPQNQNQSSNSTNFSTLRLNPLPSLRRLSRAPTQVQTNISRSPAHLQTSIPDSNLDFIPVPPVPATAPLRTRPSQPSLSSRGKVMDKRMSHKPSLDFHPSYSQDIYGKDTRRISRRPSEDLNMPKHLVIPLPTPSTPLTSFTQSTSTTETSTPSANRFSGHHQTSTNPYYLSPSNIKTGGITISSNSKSDDYTQMYNLTNDNHWTETNLRREKTYTEKSEKRRTIDTKRLTSLGEPLPPPRGPLPCTPNSFSAILSSKSTRPSPNTQNQILIMMDFSYSLDSPPKNESVVIPLDILRRGGGYLVEWIDGMLNDQEEEKPGMTDGSSAEDTELESEEENELDALLRDEYFRSLYIASPTEVSPPSPAPPPVPSLPSSITYPKPSTYISQTNNHISTRQIPTDNHSTYQSSRAPNSRAPTPPPRRAAFRNQYTQQAKFPSPSSSYTLTLPGSIQQRRIQAPRDPLRLQGPLGTIIELRILLLRDASCYHAIAHRLLVGRFPPLGEKRRRVEEECDWLGMKLGEELSRGKSMVFKGGNGFI